MSSSCRPVCLLVLLGAVMALGSSIKGYPDNLIPMEKSIQSLLKLTDVGTNLLFSSVLESINTSCQRKEDIMLMNTTLSIYMQMFSSILHHSHGPEQEQGRSSTFLLDQLSSSDRNHVKEVVTSLQQKTENLTKSLGQLNHDNQDVLSQLHKIKVDDPVNQRKALAEFTRVYKAASNLVQ